MTIEDWIKAFQGDKFYTAFEDWDDYYLKYNGDWHKKESFPVWKNRD